MEEPRSQQKYQQELDHARSRVSFFKSLVDFHLRTAPEFRLEGWEEKADLLRRRCAVAEDALRRLERVEMVCRSLV